MEQNNGNKDFGTGVKFEEYGTERSYSPEVPKLVQWIMKYSGGLIKNENQAAYVLIGFVAAAIIVSLFLLFGGGENKSPSKEEIFRVTPPSTSMFYQVLFWPA